MSADCMWCGGNGQLETYTQGGDIDVSTDCVCVLCERVAVLEAALRHILRQDFPPNAYAAATMMRGIAARALGSVSERGPKDRSDTDSEGSDAREEVQ